MSDPISGVNTTKTSDQTHSLVGLEPGDVNSAGSNLRSPALSEQVASQVKAITEPLTKELEHLCNLMRELQLRDQRLEKRPIEAPLAKGMTHHMIMVI